MSYSTFKHALGETSLERKCRLLFGTCLLVLIFGALYIYAKQTNKIVYDMNRFIGKVLVDSVMVDVHKEVWATTEGVFVTKPSEQEVNLSIAKLLRTRKFDYQVIHPENKLGMREPADSFEWALMEEWTKAGQQLRDAAAAQQVRSPEEQLEVINHQTAIDEIIDERMAEPNTPFGREQPTADETVYRYYQPVFTKQGCLTCHHVPIGDDVPYREDLQAGDLLAMVRIQMDTADTQDRRRANQALLILLGVVIVFLAMAALYVIIRYVIVKPIEHLRDVSNAVRRGETEQRAKIHTGDEFEELGAAFNRMLRQLLRQQDELGDINSELDGKLDELAQANMRLFEMNQLKSDFLATVSHELRTPLNSIIGFSDLLRTIEGLDDKQRRYAENIQKSGKSLLEMINDILDLAKIESGRMELRLTDFDIGSVVLTQCDMARPLSEKKRIELDCEIAPGLQAMHQDRGKIEQILINLLSNAIKFTPDGGRIHVAVRRDTRDDLRMSVADTGIGISDSEQTLVFEKFRQGTTVLPDGNAMTREYSGTGLGLSIVRELCRLLGGDITVESELGNGSEFTVILPWSYTEYTRTEPPLAAELKQLTKQRYEPVIGGSP